MSAQGICIGLALIVVIWGGTFAALHKLRVAHRIIFANLALAAGGQLTIIAMFALPYSVVKAVLG